MVSAQNWRYDPFHYQQLSKYIDSKQTDFSIEYRQWLTPDATQRFTDIINDILTEDYTFENSLFNTELFIYEGMDGRASYYEPTEIQVSTAGVYIVRTKGTTVKVAVR